VPGNPLVSILVPTYQAARVLPGCLDALWAQDYAGGMEVVVADGGSTDGTRDLVIAAAAAGRPIRLVLNPERNQAAGLNRAAAAARGAILVRCDAQARLPQQAIRRLVDEHERAARANVGGRQVALPPGGPFGDAVAAVYNTPLGSGGAAYRTGATRGDSETVYLGSWRVEDFAAAGGFDPAFLANQDTEFNVRWLRQGGRVRLLPDIAVGYVPRDAPWRLARQYARYGFWRARTFRTHGDLRPRQLLALGPLVAVLLALAAPVTGWALAPLAAYLAVVIVAGLTVKARPTARFLAPVALAIMHLSWGVGFAAGLVAPWQRRASPHATDTLPPTE
jgi:succinoglycan biosynthesis protein ExoA